MKEYKLIINGNNYAVTVVSMEDSVAEIEVNGTPYRVDIERPSKKKPTISKISRPTPAPVAAPAPVSRPAAATVAGSGTPINAPLPGVIVEISVKVGDQVKRGQQLLILEAMKMENVIESTEEGTVTSIEVNQGDSVLEGTPLIVIG